MGGELGGYVCSGERGADARVEEGVNGRGGDVEGWAEEVGVSG